MAQNVIDLGFDVDKLSNEQKKVLSSLTEVYNQAVKLSEYRIQVKFADGSADLKKSIDQLKVGYTSANGSISSYNDLLIAQADAANKAAEANRNLLASTSGTTTVSSGGSDNSSTDQNTTSTQQNTSAKQENTSATASNTSANKENAQSAYESAQAFRAGMEEVGYNINQYLNLQRQLTAVRNQIKEVSAAQSSSAESMDQKQTTLVGLITREKELQATMRTTSQLINAQIKDNVAAEGSYDQLQAVLLQMDRTFKQLSATERSSETGTTLLKNMQSVDEELKKIDASMGVYRRNVGNYASAVSGAFGQTFARTVHAGSEAVMGMSRGVNALAIDLPNLIQEFMEMSNAQKQAKASGGEYLTTMQLLKAAFNPWTIVLQLGIMLLVKHGGELINWVTGAEAAKKKAEELKKAQEELNTAYKGSMETSAQSIAKLKELATTAANTNLQMSTRLAAVKAMKQEYPALLKNYSDEDLLSKNFANTLKNVLIPQLWAAAKARALGAKIEVLAKQDLDNIDKGSVALSKLWKARDDYNKSAANSRNIQKSLTADNNTIQAYRDVELRDLKNLKKAEQEWNDAKMKGANNQIQANKLLNDQQKELAKAGNAATDVVTTGGGKTGKTKDTSSEYNKDIEAQRAANEKKLQLQAEYYKSISDLEIANIDTRQSALDKWNDIEKKIITDNQKFKLSEKKLSDGEIQKINQEAVTALWKQDNAYAKAGLQVWTSYLANRQRVLTELNKQQAELTTSLNNSPVEGNTMPTRSGILKTEQSNYEERLSMLNSFAVSRNLKLETMYKSGQITQEEYQKKTLENQKQSIQDQLDTTTQMLNNLVDQDAVKGNEDQVDALKEKIKELRLELEKLKKTPFDIKAENINKVAAQMENVSSVLSNITSAMSSINDIGYDNQITAVEDLEASQQKQYEKEVANINNSTLSETDKANKLKVLEAQRQAQSEANDRKQKKAEVEKAKFDKAMNIATAIANGAVAFTKALTAGPIIGPILAASIAVLTTAQVAKLVATKIPEYAEGTDNHPGGPAIVGEGKNKELVQMPGGKSFIADKPMMMNLPKSTKVLPLDEKVFSLYANNASDYLSNGVISMTERSQAMDQAQNWNIAKWQVKQMEKMYGRNNQNIINRVSTKVDFGWMSYVNSKVFGKNKRA